MLPNKQTHEKRVERSHAQFTPFLVGTTILRGIREKAVKHEK